jgi:hypothetical protein
MNARLERRSPTRLDLRRDTNAPERELSHCQAEVRLATLRQATRLSRFSARGNIRAAVWDKPRSSRRRAEERRFMGKSLVPFGPAHRP